MERLEALEALAKVEEHQMGEFTAALAHTEEAEDRVYRIGLAPDQEEAWIRAFAHRARRLRVKLARASGPRARAESADFPKRQRLSGTARL